MCSVSLKVLTKQICFQYTLKASNTLFMWENGNVVLAITTVQYPTSSKKYMQCCFHFIFKKTATLMENVDRTQNVNSHNKFNKSTKVKIVHKKFNFNISEIVGFIV